MAWERSWHPMLRELSLVIEEIIGRNVLYICDTFFPIEHGVLFSHQAQHHWFSQRSALHHGGDFRQLCTNSVSVPSISHFTPLFLFSSYLALLTLCLGSLVAGSKGWMWPFTGQSLIFFFVFFLLCICLNIFFHFLVGSYLNIVFIFCYFSQPHFPYFEFF